MLCYSVVYNSVDMQFRFHISITSILTNLWIAICIFPGIAVSLEICLGACEKFKIDLVP
jgi:hypothetical protein